MKAGGIVLGHSLSPLTWMVQAWHYALLHSSFVRVRQSRSDQGDDDCATRHEPLDVVAAAACETKLSIAMIEMARAAAAETVPPTLRPSVAYSFHRLLSRHLAKLTDLALAFTYSR